MVDMSEISKAAIETALMKVIDPEINRPLPELDMIRRIDIAEDNTVTIAVDLTVAGCPLKDKITAEVKKEVGAVPGVSTVEVETGVMSPEQREALKEKLSGPRRQIQFNIPGNLTRIYAITSGKGGVGKSSMTANLAMALTQKGLKVGVLDADIYGFSIPRMLGIDENPTVIDGLIIPPQAAGIKVISIGMFVEEGQAVVWRGPMLHRALQQFLADVHWGDLDILLLDLPPGTGDVAISISQLLPGAEILVITTPQVAAAEVAQRAGAIAAQTEQRVVGVIENMSYLEQPDGSRMELFGAGGGDNVSQSLTKQLGYEIPLLAKIPLQLELRQGADIGVPVVATHPDSGATQAIYEVANKLAKRSAGLAGINLGIKPIN